MTKKQVSTGQDLYRKAIQRIPGGTQLLSKRPEMFLPGEWPAYYSKAQGAEVWDLDGNKYIDMTYSGIGSCVLGFSDPDVNEAVRKAIDAGSMSTLNCAEDIELADLLCELHPWAEMVRYARCGGEAMAVSVRIARAKNRRDKVAFCGYHGWQDWYLAANLSDGHALDGQLLPGLDPTGVPRALAGTALPFHYNNVDELKALASKHELAAIIMEPVRGTPPAPGFHETIREIATKTGAVLIFDEVTSGWRLNAGGVHMVYGTMPDIAVFAKGMGNGYPMAAIIGKADVMQAAQETFISSTYWTERIGPTAALATIRKFIRCNVAEHLIQMGNLMQNGWQAAASRHGLAVKTSGIPPLSHFNFDHPEDRVLRTIFTRLMLGRGFLASGAFYSMYAHTKAHVDAYMVAADATFKDIADALKRDDLKSLLPGPTAHSGFARLT
jgi:glutamate-1-semialdehyde 2,1-aminomutase